MPYEGDGFVLYTIQVVINGYSQLKFLILSYRYYDTVITVFYGI